jgi:hypothetical protein
MFIESFHHPLAILLAQIVTIIVLPVFWDGSAGKSGNQRLSAKSLPDCVGAIADRNVFSRLHRSPVPRQFAWQPPVSEPNRLILFMFVVGMESRPESA